MEVSINRKMANKTIVVISVMALIGLGVLNTFNNMPLGEKNNIVIKPKSHVIKKVSTNKSINKNINKNRNVAPNNKAKNTVVAYNKRLTSRGGYGNIKYNNELFMEATAYTSSYSDTGKSPGDPGFGITATGTRAKVGTVAVDPNVIPLGSKLYIKSLDGRKDYGYAVAEDTGGAIKNSKIDLYFNTEYDAIQFGRRKVKVYVLR